MSEVDTQTPGTHAGARHPADGWPGSAPDPRLEELVSALGIEEGSRSYVSELRWPNGVTCPRCGSERTGLLEVRRKHYCQGCKYQFRVSAGTIFHDSHVSLARWLVAVQLMLESERGFPATQLQEVIGGSYKTAWFVGHRIRAAMSRSFLDLGMPLALARAIAEAEQLETSEPLLQPGGSAADGWRLVKRLVAGAYHRPSPEYLTAYWNESRWRAASIDSETAFRETIRALLETQPLTYDELISHSRTITPAST
jgi:transposase-like protein